MSFKQYNTKSRRMQERFARIVEFCVKLYILFALLWTVCYLVGDIFTKLGVG